MTTTLGAITPGEAFVGLADQWHSQTVEVHSDSTVAVLINNEKKTAVALCGHNVSDQVRANAALYADAHNTAQKTGKLPSQLLQERDELVGALRGMDVERMNCRKRVEKDGTLNHGPTCRSTVPNERTDRADWCHVCHATEILSKYPKP